MQGAGHRAPAASLRLGAGHEAGPARGLGQASQGAEGASPSETGVCAQHGQGDACSWGGRRGWSCRGHKDTSPRRRLHADPAGLRPGRRPSRRPNPCGPQGPVRGQRGPSARPRVGARGARPAPGPGRRRAWCGARPASAPSGARRAGACRERPGARRPRRGSSSAASVPAAPRTPGGRARGSGQDPVAAPRVLRPQEEPRARSPEPGRGRAGGDGVAPRPGPGRRGPRPAELAADASGGCAVRPVSPPGGRRGPRRPGGGVPDTRTALRHTLPCARAGPRPHALTPCTRSHTDTLTPGVSGAPPAVMTRDAAPLWGGGVQPRTRAPRPAAGLLDAVHPQGTRSLVQR